MHFCRVSLEKPHTDGSSHPAAPITTLTHKTRLAFGEIDVAVSDAVVFTFH